MDENSKKSPWHIESYKNPVSLNAIMSEEKAKGIQEREDRIIAESLQNCIDVDEGNSSEEIKKYQKEEKYFKKNECDNDFLLAQLLQEQFDSEYDQLLKKREDKVNGASKVSISYSNYRLTPKDKQIESDSEEEQDEPIQHWDRFVSTEQTFQSIPKCGYMKKEGQVVTKHDIGLSDRRNACKILNFPPEFHTGDGEDFDMKLSNKVFNTLKVHSHNKQSRNNRFDDKREHSTAEMSIDAATKLVLFRLVNIGILENVNGVISTGKESVVLHADGGCYENGDALPKSCAIKIFKTVLTDFKNRADYVEGDFRFKGKLSKKKLINTWAEKEMNNLLRMKNAGIFCPEVVLLKKHVLVMSFIGEGNTPASKLKHANIDTEQIDEVYSQVCETMKKMYNQANLVHADLSEYNILWYNGKCWFIDVGQAVEKTHPKSQELLKRDCININNFFNKISNNIWTDERLYSFITDGELIPENDHIKKIQEFDKNLENLTLQDPDIIYPFNFYWDESQKM